MREGGELVVCGVVDGGGWGEKEGLRDGCVECVWMVVCVVVVFLAIICCDKR